MARSAHLLTFQSRYDATALTGPEWNVGQSDTANYKAITVPTDATEFVIIGTTAGASVVDAPTGHTLLFELAAAGITSQISWMDEVSGALSSVTDALGSIVPWMTLRGAVNSGWGANDELYAGSINSYDSDGDFPTYNFDVASYVSGHTRYSMFAVIVYDDNTLGIPIVTLPTNEESFFSLLASNGYNWGTTAMSMYLFGGIGGFYGVGVSHTVDFQVNFSGTDFSRVAGSMPQVFGGGVTVA